MNREELEHLHGEVWNLTQVQADFVILSFSAPHVEVIRKADGAKGVLSFQHAPRFYFSFEKFNLNL